MRIGTDLLSRNALLLNFCYCLVWSSTNLYSEYDEKIIELGHHGRHLQNIGRAAEANAFVDVARRAFSAAWELAPSSPKAYSSLAATLLKTRKFDESIFFWESAIQFHERKHVRSWIHGRIRHTRFEKLSTRTEEIYDRGQGNISLALQLMKKQLRLYPGEPAVKHFKATAEVALSEMHGANFVSAAVSDFLEAQQLAHAAWSRGLLDRSSNARCAVKNGSAGQIVRNWTAWNSLHLLKKGAMKSLTGQAPGWCSRYGSSNYFYDCGGYVAHFKDVALSGPNGMIVDDSRCHIYVPSGGWTMNFAYDLQMLAIWQGYAMPGSGQKYDWFDFHNGFFPSHGQVSKPRMVKKVASVVQFAQTSYFHSLTEVCGRWWLLHRHGVFDDPEVLLVASQDPREPGVLLAPLRFLASDFNGHRIIWWKPGWDRKSFSGFPDIQLRASELFYADWTAPASLGEDGGHSSTPRSILKGIRKRLLSKIRPKRGEKTALRAMIFAVRRGQAMRNMLDNETDLTKGLMDIADLSWPKLAFKTFDGQLTLPATVRLFSQAKAVIGVHGGALSNILFCPHDVQVFELGFSTPFAGHYRHLAAAMEINMTMIPLAADIRGIGAKDVKLASFPLALKVIHDVMIHPSTAERQTRQSALVGTEL